MRKGSNEKQLTGVCQQCNKSFSYYPTSTRTGVKVHCSRACQMAASNARALTTCPTCGKRFEYYKSWPRKFCSRSCSAAVNAKQNLGIEELPPAWCEVCGEQITGNRSREQRFCSLACFGVYLRRTRTGVPRPGLAKERPDLQKRVDKTCPVCGKEFQVKESHAVSRICCSRKCGAKRQEQEGLTAGPKNGNFKGGYLPYYGPNWRAQRRKARQRDGYKCRRCGISEKELGRQLDVHHVKPFREFGVERYHEANRLSNLLSLCNVCHKIVEPRGLEDRPQLGQKAPVSLLSSNVTPQ
jgi:5-methylcytosine-specific restriction endonuclease McrA